MVPRGAMTHCCISDVRLSFLRRMAYRVIDSGSCRQPIQRFSQAAANPVHLILAWSCLVKASCALRSLSCRQCNKSISSDRERETKATPGSNSPQHAEKKSGLARLSRPAKHCGEIEGGRSVKEFMRRLMIPIPFDRSSAAAEVLRFRSHV